MNTNENPFIVCLPNGPYYLIEDSNPQEVPCLVSESGQTQATVRGVALCRCGLSENKPFCDGSHGTSDFSDEKSEERVKDRLDSYVGTHITVHFNGGACAHAAHCVNDLPSVFRMGANPWIEPDAASVEEIVAQIGKCPSGALSCSVNGVLQTTQQGDPEVTVLKDGPYAVAGGISLIGQEWGNGVSEQNFVLCRCGASKNKPFCDGSHAAIGFKG